MLSPQIQATVHTEVPVEKAPTEKVPVEVSPVTDMLVVIDPGVNEYPQLAARVVPGAEVLLLDPEQDAIAQIAHRIERRHQQKQPAAKNLHLVAQGSPGALHFASGDLSLATLHEHATALKSWFASVPRSSVSPMPSLLLSGGLLGEGEADDTFLRQLALLTGAIVSVGPATL
ncbi:MAG: DUF4347 domain-containing protein [Cyanobacteria bacterium P01_F01_bin.53]